MTFRILLAVDGSEAASHALAWAIPFARRIGAELVACSVLDPMLSCAAGAGGALIDPRPMLESLRADARSFGLAAVARCAAAHLPATSVVLEGDAAFAIAEFAHLRSPDLIVLGTHARQGIALDIAGSVTDDVVRATSTPVIAVRLGTAAAQAGPILVAVDESAASADVTSFALRLARSLPCPVHLVHVDAGNERAVFRGFPTLARQAAAAGVACTTEVRLGDRVSSLVAAAHDCRAALLATGTHGRGGLARIFLGSVAEGLIRASPVPVLVVRHSG